MSDKPDERSLFPLRIPGGCVVFNALYETPESEHEQSSLLIVRQDSELIDLSWLPDGDPNGQYVLQVVSEKSSANDDPWQHPLYRFSTKSRAEAIAMLERVLAGERPHDRP